MDTTKRYAEENKLLQLWIQHVVIILFAMWLMAHIYCLLLMKCTAFGSPARRNILKINAGERLGLSATPIRYGDPEGTAAIF